MIIKPPSKWNLLNLRALIILGIISIINFLFWFFQPEFIDDEITFALLTIVIFFDSFRLIYIWYHYWSISIPKKPQLIERPSVDILTTYFPGEPKEMLIKTLKAIDNITYPHRTILCDEANDPTLRDYCKKNNILHVSRNNRIDAKAGNINNGLKYATGELCLILDPDHIPKPNFLDELVPYFEDKTVGFVQSVQAYYNISESKVARGASEQTFQFYGPVMMTMNSYGTVNAIGANCLFRRSALDSIGGHAPGLSEDMHTAMKLHAEEWRSIYVPKALTLGLVPSTLKSYYKQQLKWSRGTMELLVSVYPKIFKKLNWRQKIHYGVLPFHYLSGLIYMFSFLIPIISLFNGTTPWDGNVVQFGLATLPVISVILIIRFYTQKWLINKRERGIHILGGILMHCTWWVYLLGLLYTLIRKKVLYIPTDKNSESKENLTYILPNIIIASISIIAIIYGLHYDFTPFSIMMSGFALWNSFVLLYTLYLAIEKPKNACLPENSFYNNKQQAYNKNFRIFNMLSLPISLLIFGITMIAQFRIESIKNYGFENNQVIVENSKYVGVFAPKVDNGLSELMNIRDFTKILNDSIDIVSFYIPWNHKEQVKLPNQLLKSVKEKYIPLITWEPWYMERNDNGSFDNVFALINDGLFDNYISRFAISLKSLNTPVYLRFAHEFDNQFYPWYDNGPKASEIFKEAWRRIHSLFDKNKVHNVIWVYNPWKPENLIEFYPGNDFVDWFSFNILDYSGIGGNDLDYSFKQLYDPFHNIIKDFSKKPVMISEFGSLKNGDEKKIWINNALDILNYEFDEIRAIVYFNSNVDNNLPLGNESNQLLNWKLNENSNILKAFKTDQPSAGEFKFSVRKPSKYSNNSDRKKFSNDIKGVNLVKGTDWKRDYHVLDRQNLESDFFNMKRIGLQTIKFVENETYDYNVLNISREFDLKVVYGFWISENIDFVNDTDSLEKIENHILESMENYKDVNIIGWVIDNDVLNSIQQIYSKPERLYQEKAYLDWLNGLLKKVDSIDNKPFYLNVNISNNTLKSLRLLERNLNNFDGIGLNVLNVDFLEEVLEYLNDWSIDYIYSNIKVDDIKWATDITKKSFFINSWQDQHEIDRVGFNGLIDRKGRYKPNFYKLKAFIDSSSLETDNLSIGIVKPAKSLVTGYPYEYHAMILKDGKTWIPGTKTSDYIFEWSLLRLDNMGNFTSVLPIGTGPVMKVKTPSNYQQYRLQLSALKDDRVWLGFTTLNLPFN